MASELMLINPRRKRRSRRAKVTHARRNPRRRRRNRLVHARRNPRRRRKMSALQMQYFGGKRRHKHRRRNAGVTAMKSNPRRRRHRRHLVSMRRNPRDFVTNPVGFMEDTLIPAGIGALGGVMSNYIFANYAPANLQVGAIQPISQLALAALLGAGVGAMTDEHTGAMVGAGAMTVTLYQMIENYLNTGQLYASLPPSYGAYSQWGGPYRQSMGRFVKLGRIMRFGRIKGNMGYISPARQMANA